MLIPRDYPTQPARAAQGNGMPLTRAVARTLARGLQYVDEVVARSWARGDFPGRVLAPEVSELINGTSETRIRLRVTDAGVRVGLVMAVRWGRFKDGGDDEARPEIRARVERVADASEVDKGCRWSGAALATSRQRAPGGLPAWIVGPVWTPDRVVEVTDQETRPRLLNVADAAGEEVEIVIEADGALVGAVMAYEVPMREVNR